MDGSTAEYSDHHSYKECSDVFFTKSRRFELHTFNPSKSDRLTNHTMSMIECQHAVNQTPRYVLKTLDRHIIDG